MSESDGAGSGQAAPSRRGRWPIAVVAAAVVIVGLLVAAVILSPSLSPLAGIHDSDGDGYADSDDEFPDDASEWSDEDDDGWGDNCDEFPEDPTEWSDTDDDGWGDNCDEFPEDDSEHIDSDDDGVGDNSDEFPDDPDECEDTDGDGYGDNSDLFPGDPDLWAPVLEVLSSCPSCSVVRMEVESIIPAIPWDDIRIGISDGTDDASWIPYADDLDEESYTAQDYAEQELGEIVVYLRAVDTEGDGKVSAEDKMEIYVSGSGFDSDVEYNMSLTHVPTCTVLEYYCFTTPADAPTASLTVSAIEDGYRFVLGAVSVDDLYWDVVTIELSDGEHDVTWSDLLHEDLDDGVADLQSYGIRDLGTLSVELVVGDLAGNGDIDMGDYFTLTATSFEVGTTYTVSVIYEPSGEAIGSVDFGEPADTPVSALTKTSIVNGWKFTFVAITLDTSWSDVAFVLGDGEYSCGWTNISSDDLDDGIGDIKNYGSSTLGSISVTLTVMDIAGNGEIDGGDYFTLVGDFSAATDYTIYVLFEPTSGVITMMTFSG